MTKLTEEELSRVLSAHDQGVLRTGGGSQGPCLMQAADCTFDKDSYAYICCDVLTPSKEAAKWFDHAYVSSWTAEQFLARLILAGLA
jgi:hypothetical protein